MELFNKGVQPIMAEVGAVIGGVRLLKSKLIDKELWWNTRLRKWVPRKYESRTKYKELRPYVLVARNVFDMARINMSILPHRPMRDDVGEIVFYTHPDNYEYVKAGLEKNLTTD